MELKRPHDIDPRQMRETIEAGRDIAGLGAWSWDERNQTKFWGAPDAGNLRPGWMPT